MGVIFAWIRIADIVNAINKLKVTGEHLFPPPPSCLPVKQKARLLPGFLLFKKQKTPQNLYCEK
jgi:hypothetical protein